MIVAAGGGGSGSGIACPLAPFPIILGGAGGNAGSDGGDGRPCCDYYEWGSGGGAGGQSAGGAGGYPGGESGSMGSGGDGGARAPWSIQKATATSTDHVSAPIPAIRIVGKREEVANDGGLRGVGRVACGDDILSR